MTLAPKSGNSSVSKTIPGDGGLAEIWRIIIMSYHNYCKALEIKKAAQMLTTLSTTFSCSAQEQSHEAHRKQYKQRRKDKSDRGGVWRALVSTLGRLVRPLKSQSKCTLVKCNCLKGDNHWALSWAYIKQQKR